MNIIKRVSRRLNTKRSSFNEQDGSPSSSRDSSEYFSAVEHSTADQNNSTNNHHHQAYLSASMSHVISAKRQSQSLDPRNSASLSDLGLSSSSSHHQQYHHQRSSLTSRRTITSLKRNSVNSAGGTSALNGSSNNSSHPGYVPSYCKFKIGVIGASKTGKSRMCLRFAHDIYSDNYQYEETIQDIYTKSLHLNLTEYYQQQGISETEPHAKEICADLEIFDTGGCSNTGDIDLNDGLSEVKWEEMDGFILMYDVENKDSFRMIQSFYDRATTSRKRMSLSGGGSGSGGSNSAASKLLVQMPVILVANKIDLPESSHHVSPEHGSKMGRALGCKTLRISVKDNLQVNVCFEALVKEILNCRYMRPDADLFMSMFGGLAGAEGTEQRPEDRKSIREFKDLMNKRLSKRINTSL